jgi:hypothetical protein
VLVTEFENINPRAIGPASIKAVENITPTSQSQLGSFETKLGPPDDDSGSFSPSSTGGGLGSAKIGVLKPQSSFSGIRTG